MADTGRSSQQPIQIARIFARVVPCHPCMGEEGVQPVLVLYKLSRRILPRDATPPQATIQRHSCKHALGLHNDIHDTGHGSVGGDHSPSVSSIGPPGAVGDFYHGIASPLSSGGPASTVVI